MKSMENEKVKSIHPYEPFIPKGATKLIIGTMPPRRFCIPGGKLYENDVLFYYGSKDNNFWNIVSNVFGAQISFDNSKESIDQRKALLEEHGIGITDIVNSCYHVDGHSTDDKLANETFKDVMSLLKNNPDIEQLIYTGTNVISYMNKAVGGWHSWCGKGRWFGKKTINGREYIVKRIKSPSPRAGWKHEELCENYKNTFLGED